MVSPVGRGSTTEATHLDTAHVENQIFTSVASEPAYVAHPYYNMRVPCNIPDRCIDTPKKFAAFLPRIGSRGV